MFRNQYDGDISTWSPQGRLHQIEYAMEAVKQGSAAIGLKSKTHVVIAAIKRSTDELASYQRKVFKVDDHIGVAVAGLTADGRVLLKYMRNEAMNHNYVYDTPMQVGRLATIVADKAQVSTQRYGKRPYGVGLLIAGYDRTGAHLFETDPSGNYLDYKAQAIGARSQSSRTYLERSFSQFENCTLDELIMHGLTALREASTGKEQEDLSVKNVSLAVVGLDTPYRLLEGADIQPYLARLADEAPADPMVQ